MTTEAARSLAITLHHGWWGDGLALIAGLLLPFAFAPYGFFPLAVLAPALLFYSWEGCDSRRAGFRGWLFGLAMFGGGVFWIRVSFTFSAVDPLVAGLLMAGFVAVMALYPALLGLLLGCLSSNLSRPLRLLMLWPAAWVLMEWLRGYLFSGFSWLQLGYSQIDAPLSGWAPLVGIFGLGWMMAFTAGVLLLCFGRRLPLFPLLLVIFLWGSGAGLQHVSWTDVSGPALPVALIQGNIPQEQKWLPEMRAPILERYVGASRANSEARLIIWPETALPGFAHRYTDLLAGLRTEMRARNTEVLLGLPVWQREGKRNLNAATMLGDGTDYYYKRHLVPFGEFLPMANLLRPILRRLGAPLPDFSPGPDQPPLLSMVGTLAAVLICYEVAFARDVLPALPEAAFLVNISNDAWFGNSIGPHQHLEMARMRALESGRYLLRATNTGISAVVSPAGKVLARSPQFEFHVLRASLTPMAGATPYVRMGNTPILLAALCLLLLAAWRRLRGVREG